MTADDIRTMLATLDGARILVASAEQGAPEIAWGDTFVYYDPDRTHDQKWPFATIVHRDTPGWDEVSALSARDDRFRLNLDVGRDAQPDVDPATVDYAQNDTLLPHPQYAAQGWVSIVAPTEASKARLVELTQLAHQRAVARHERRRRS